METLIICLLATSAVICCIAAILANTLRKRRAHDLESSLSPETSSHYKDKDSPLDFLDDEDDENHQQTTPASLPSHITLSNTSRAAWVLRMTRHVFTSRHAGRHNVVVINNDLPYHFAPEDEVERFMIEYKNSERPWVVPYSVVVFGQGVLVNRGDGGDINWDWMGNFKREGDGVLSFEPCVTGVVYKQDPWNAV